MMKEKNTFLRAALSVVFVVWTAHAAFAFDPFTVKNIQVEGLQRIESGTVFATLPVHIGDTYTDDKATESIRALYALGLFKEVNIKEKDGVLIVNVLERPNIAAINIVGAKTFDDATLKKVLAEVGLAPGRPFEQALLDNSEQELKRQYTNKGMYSTKVLVDVTPTGSNRVNINLNIKEAGVAKISDIKIIGNTAFSQSTLLDLFNLNNGTWLSWYTKSNQYTRTKLNADLEALRSFYMSKGYLEFKIESTQVAITPDKSKLNVVINIHEGPRFVVSKIVLGGNFLNKNDEFRSLVTIAAGKPYNADQVAGTVRAFNQYFGDFGYAFSNVEVQSTVNHDTNQVELTLVGNPSRRVYIRYINVMGNDRTRDVVIRREFRQFEGTWYDGEKIRQSRERVDRLGFFTNVSVDVKPIASRQDQVDLQISVTERPTGSVSLGANLSSSDGLGLMFGFQQNNAFGSGNGLGLQINTSKVNRQISLNITDPYFTEDGASRTIDIYQNTSRPYADLNSYSISKVGANVSYGIPISENDMVYAGIGINQTKIVPGSLLPKAYQDFVNKNGYANSAVPISLGWGRNSLNNALAPTSGKLIRLKGEVSVAGQMHYTKFTASYAQYVPLTRTLTFAFNSNLGLGYGLSGKDYPLFENFFEGGLGSVRGFSQSLLRTRDQRKDNIQSIGGAKMVDMSVQLLAPLPGAGTDPTLRWFAFTDAGGIYGANEPVSIDGVRASVGVGLSWLSPVGPLSLAFARPVRYFKGDDLQFLQFQIGQTF
jgi:outer membrane protein insertion porin family